VRSRAASLVVPALFAVAVVVLLVAGRGRLAAPPLGHLGSWIEAAGPVVATVALLRLAALVAAAWMLVVTALSRLARLAGAVALAGALDHAVPVPLRKALGGLAGAGVAGALVVGVAGGPSADAAAPTAVERLVRLPEDPADPAPVETMSVLREEPSPQAPSVPTAGVASTPDTWTAVPGDSFWSIAEEVLAERIGRPPTDPELEPFWRTVIDANRDRLVSGDADLIFPGQVFVLPEPA
jgi:nucleoid-associated protein YgaU